MRNRVGLILGLAVVSGLLAAYLAYRFLRQPTLTQPAEAAEVTTVNAVVAARDMPAGTMLQADDVLAIAWPSGNLPQGVARDPGEVVGRGLIEQVRRNEPILASKIAAPGTGHGIQLSIPRGMRSVAVRVNDVIGVGGWLHPGMRVDVIVVLDQGAQIDEPTTQTVVQDVTVHSVGQINDTNDENEAVLVTVVNLVVDPDQAQKITLAETKGTIRLALRNPLDRDTIDLQDLRARELLTGRQRSIVSTGPVRRAAPVPTSRSVEIIRGTEKETQEVENRSGGGGGR